jgi:tocopherol cyclase
MNQHINSYIYHGQKKTTDFFEGWYFKHVHEAENMSFALIPGISKNPVDPHAFIQLIITPAMIIKYFRFDVQDFKSTDEPFQVEIAQNRFTLDYIDVRLKDEEFHFGAQLSYINRVSIQNSWYAPNIMGPFSYLPKMECNHGVVSMNHTIKGSVELNQKRIDFDGEKGYIEKDWGTSFPKKYVWLQCNHFDDPSLYMMGSIALIPYVGLSFEGLIFNIVHHGKEYRFATYNLSSFRIEQLNETSRKIVLKKGSLICEIFVGVTKLGGLKSPRLGQMSEMIKEGLDGTMRLKLYQGNQVIVDSMGKYAGVEFTGY